MPSKSLALAALLAASVPVLALAETPWDVSLPRGEVREIDFTTREGTWMSLDLSPDGRWIVFDLLGHIYRLPAAGGEAECLTQGSGVALNIHPRFSPDGRSIAFVSDRGGHPHLWVMNADGSDPREIPTDPRYRLLQPAWSPDGKHLYAKRWDGLYRISLDSTEGKTEELLVEQPAQWPSPSRDGRFLYFYALRPIRDSNEIRGDLADGRTLRRLDLSTGQAEDVPVAALPGGALAPQISPDGRRLAFARRVPGGTTTWRGHVYAARTVLRVRDLETGDERVVMDPIETDLTMEFDNKQLRELPGYVWSADGSSILLSQGGQIRRLNVRDGRIETIPFTARVRRTISQQANASHRIDDGPLRVRMLRWPVASPDGRRLAFQALNKIWVTGEDREGGSPRRLTPESFPDPEWTPSWSPDGRWIAFTTWDDPGRGHVWKAPAAGGEPVRLTSAAGEYLHPVWTPEGRELLIVRGPGVYAPGFTWADNPWYELALLPSGGGELRTLIRVSRPRFVPYEPYSHRREIAWPSFGPDGRIFFPEQREQDGDSVTDLVSIDRSGGDRKVHASFPNANETTPSPDGRWIAWEAGGEVFVHPFPQPGTDGKPPLLDRRAEGFAGRQLTTDGGLAPRWIDAGTLGIGDGDRYYLCKGPADCRLSVREVRLERPRNLPSGSLALTGARLVTLDRRQVIERGTVVVRRGRIACVGDCDVRGVDRVIDAAGTTIVPGFVDMHAHHSDGQAGIIPWRNYEAAAYLAYGATTTFDPDAGAQNAFSAAETVETGGMVGPRLFSTGDPIFSNDGPNWLEVRDPTEARSRVQRLAGWGAPTIKEYLQPRRPQRQWLMEAAREAGLRVTSEAASYEENLTRVMDGGTGFEHALGFAPMYGDVSRFFGQAGFFYSPTFQVSGPGPESKELFLSRVSPEEETRLRRFLPPSYLLPRLHRKAVRPETAYGFPLVAEGLADVIAAGGGGAIGSHGELHGLGSHWEIWMAATALGPHGALELASLQGARFLGVERDLGTLTAGKLADLLVLEKNPLDDIRNTTSLRWVMKGGTLYDAETLDEVWPEAKPFGRFTWRVDQ